MMFGGLQLPAKPDLKPRPVPKIVDVTGINVVAHMAPDPRTCYNYKMMQYRQRKKEFEDKKELGCINNLHNDKIAVQYLKHFEKKEGTRSLNDRVNEKMAEYDRQIEIRREKLRKLFYEEERLFVKEVVDTAQKAEELIMEERIQKLKTIKEQRIAENLEIARQNKLRQYLDRCAEFRPVLIKQRLRESKEAQLQQIQENETRKIQERELEQMWHEIAMKEMKKQIQREEKEAMEKKKNQEEIKCMMSTYMKEQEEQIEKRKQVLNEEKKMLDKLGEEIALENKAEQEAKLRKRNEICGSIKSQIKERQKMLNEQANNEMSIANAFHKLVEQEQEKERLEMKQKMFSGKQDMILYQEYLKELRQQQLAEEAQLEEIVRKSMHEIQKKQNEEKCNFEMARKALLETVLKERAEQIEYQKRQIDEQERLKKLEVEWSRKTKDLNEQLTKEQERQNKLAALKYGDELRKQMEYSKVCENRLKKELEDILELAKTEDKLYNDIVSQTMEGKIQVSEIHPFSRLIKEQRCQCPK